jgi:hypothetical protein
MDTIRAELLARRRQSLRAWCHARAEAWGEDPQRIYDLTRRTIQRRLASGLPPLGPGGARIAAALRADIDLDRLREVSA